MKITFHSWLRTEIGKDFEEIEIPEKVITINDLAVLLGTKYQSSARLFENPDALRYVVDRRYVQPGFSISGVDLISIYPPITGG